MDWSQFHFVRPWWFLALLPILLLLLGSIKHRETNSPWQNVCDEHLLSQLWLAPPGRLGRRFVALLGLGWILTVVSLAGPVWEQQPQPVYRAELSRVLILDLSDSMNAADLAPSRLQRARFKLTDILKRTHEGHTALIVFAGESHIVTPLTSDTATIESMLPALVTDIVPARGDNAAPALMQAQQLLERADARYGQVLLITDGVADLASTLNAVGALRKSGYQTSVLGVGTTVGAPIPDSEGGFAGMSKLNTSDLNAISTGGGGVYSNLTATGVDLERVLQPLETVIDRRNDQHEEKVVRWMEHGVWLVPVILLLASIGFRRGWLGVMLVMVVLPKPSPAMDWPDFWLRKDQQGIRSLQKDQPETAAEQFQNPAWRGMALYHSGDYEEAAAAFAGVPGSVARYNRANALARAGQLERAIQAYKEVLKQQPDHADARFNLALVEDLLKQQQPPPSQPQQQPTPPERQQQPPAQQQQSEQQPKPEPQPQNQPQTAQDSGDPGQENETQESGQQPEEDTAEAARRDIEQQMKQQNQPPSNGDPAQPEQAEDGPDTPPKMAGAEALPGEDEPLDPAVEQWLRQVPDDPSGLLRRKFMLEHMMRKKGEK